MEIEKRPRRNRISGSIRALVQETSVRVQDLILPLFLHEDRVDVEIDSMPGCTRWSLTGLLEESDRVVSLGIPAVVLFPAIAEGLKTEAAEESYNPEGLIPRAVRALKERHPELTVITDVALDPYSLAGHDGLVERDAQGRLQILNDETIEVLTRQALAQAEAGADIIAPSDMMDGRVGALRRALDRQDFKGVGILSYTAKYASAFYGPFRGALGSAPKDGDKKTYQMDPANWREALREAELDEEEGADMLMVKPAGPYLDVISRLREETSLPLGAYQVSGEYLMIKSAAAAGWLDEQSAIEESLLGIKRAGASFVLTYFAKSFAESMSRWT